MCCDIDGTTRMYAKLQPHPLSCRNESRSSLYMCIQFIQSKLSSLFLTKGPPINQFPLEYLCQSFNLHGCHQTSRIESLTKTKLEIIQVFSNRDDSIWIQTSTRGCVIMSQAPSNVACWRRSHCCKQFLFPCCCNRTVVTKDHGMMKNPCHNNGCNQANAV